MAVVANDTSDLQRKYVRTKEGGVHTVDNSDLAAFLWTLMSDEYYQTKAVDLGGRSPSVEQCIQLKLLISQYNETNRGLFVKTDDGLVFGSAAVRDSKGAGFLTTGRGKRELDELAYVHHVDHSTRTVTTQGGFRASLNAPLMSTIFQDLPAARSLVHGHRQDPSLPTLPYAPPGSVRDSLRQIRGSFNIAEHGCFYVLDETDAPITWKV